MKCFIDMDGVVAHFVRGCCIIHQVKEDIWPQNQYGFPVEALGCHSEEEVWINIGVYKEHFWHGLSLMDDAKAIVRSCEIYFGADNCCFLTSPPATIPSAAVGKARWVNDHFPEYNRRLLIGNCKEFCAHKDAVLVDDYQSNLDKFKKVGGHTILVPRHWNAEHNLNTLPTVQMRLKLVTEEIRAALER